MGYRTLPIKRVRHLIVLTFLLGFIVIIIHFSPHLSRWKDQLAYSTRPLWDTDPAPKNIIPHYHYDGQNMDAAACRMHGWIERSEKVEIWDAILYSNEYDMLLLRLHSLESIVSRHILVISNTTFTGLPLPASTILPIHTPRNPSSSLPAELQRFSSKLYIHHHAGRALSRGEDPFIQEGERRRAMDGCLDAIRTEGEPLVIMSDVDEIPSLPALELLRLCDAPSPIHLQMRQYLYSYEWYVGKQSWRGAVVTWNGEGKKMGYGHGKKTEVMLASAGSHCSFCFRTLEDFRLKMTGYSHNDRLWNSPNPNHLLSDSHIQEAICTGIDLFDMLPEAYRWQDLFAWYRPDRSMDFTSNALPSYLLKHPERFEFLLPGGCLRLF